MRGEQVPAADVLIPPARVVPRRSSDTFAVEDADLSSALKYIRDNACGGLNVDDVLQHTAVSRSLLERRFREELGRSPHSQIRQVQIDRAIELLTETELPLKTIAPLAGFKHVEYLSYLFKKSTGVTPGEYRRQHGSVGHR
jgi:LacI family transcriptional regulator